MAKEIIVGIDLGTTNSVISYMQADGKVKVIPNPEGTNTTPSVVAFKASGEEIVGNAAKRQMITNPDTVRSAKRRMGTSEKFHIACLNKDFTPQEISSKVLSYMKGYAEKSLGQPVKKAVITGPHHQRADRELPRLWPRHRQERARPRLRPRGRHPRRLDPRHRGRHIPGPLDGWRHQPRGR